MLLIAVDPLQLPLAIAQDAAMRFGTESITALDYFRWVIERDDQIDAVVLPAAGDRFPMTLFWIHIEYVGSPAGARNFSKKDDGLFALRAKAGEKAERVVACTLRDGYGHRFPPEMCKSPGYFEIRYANKKVRKPDRKCLACGLTLEVKKRNRDRHFRVSHSEARPFASENAASDWHAFVFPDMKPHFVPNAAIIQAIDDGRYVPGKDRYDAWADVDSLVPGQPPTCHG